MTTYSFGYPIITGCHNTHRSEALKQIGGFAAHDADDLLMTIHYRAHDWQGVYVPEVLARGLTPVDWSGYLKQQRRWARSVLDIKFRVFPKFASRMSIPTRIVSMLHGLNYLQEGLIPLAGVMLITYLLAGADSPQLLSYLLVPEFFAFVIILQLNEFFRQRFFLCPSSEWGLHWRAGLLRYAKWPQFVLAVLDVARNRKIRYVLTAKKKSSQSTNDTAMWPHLAVVIVLSLAWIIGALKGRTFEPALHVWAGVIIISSLVLFSTRFKRFPEPFERALLDN